MILQALLDAPAVYAHRTPASTFEADAP